MKFEIYKDRKGEFRWRLIARNGNKVAISGEGYTQKHNCKKVINKMLWKMWPIIDTTLKVFKRVY